MKKRARIFFSTILIMAGLAMSGYNLYNVMFKPNNQVIEAFGSTELKLLVEDEQVTEKNAVRLTDGQVLLSYETVKKYIDPNIWHDPKESGSDKKVTITTQNKVIHMTTEKLEALVNQEPIELKIPLYEYDDTLYLPIEFLADFYDITIQYHSENQVVMVDKKSVIKRLAYPLKPDAVVRKGRSIRYPILKQFDLIQDDRDINQMYVYEEYKDWYKVRTQDGILGYILKEDVVVDKYILSSLPKPQRKVNQEFEGKINLVWEMNYSGTPDYASRENINGLDVISFTWFEVLDDQGNIANRCNPNVIRWAHENGYKVWALLANDFNDIDKTSRFLHNTEARQNLIKSILAYAALYQLDGINIDFENVYKQDKDTLTQFVRELTPLLKEQGLVVSMDVTVMGGSDTWSLCYDREALGKIVDFLCIMTYDQHWAASPVAGPVAQVSWMDKKIKEILDIVPRDKLLLGLPYYTRLWKEYTDEKGQKKVMTVRHLSVEGARNLADEKNAAISWDEDSGQYYAEYTENNERYRMWMEDETSLNIKSSIALKYQLAGICGWSGNFLQYKNDGVWEVLHRNMKVLNQYQEWESVQQDRF